MLSESSHSSRQRQRQRSPSEPKRETTKLFITNLDGKMEIKELEEELRKMFEKCGQVDSVVAKRNRNSEYCFAFAELKDHATAQECVKSYDQTSIGGKKIKVEFQDDNKRRKDSNKGCYNCGKMGHFARECQSARQDSRGYNNRSRSRSESPRRKHRRRRSGSSDRKRSSSPKAKKDRKNKSEREEKRKRKHKRSDSS